MQATRTLVDASATAMKLAVPAGGGAPLHLLASLTSIATCLFILAHLGPLQSYVGQMHISVGGGHTAGVAYTSMGGEGDGAVVEPSRPIRNSLDDCLASAVNGWWRRVDLDTLK